VGDSLKEGRQQQILEMTHDNQQVTVGELSRIFGVSEITIRRDLHQLARQGLLKRAHGGAIAIRRAPPEPPLLQRGIEQVEEKKRIGLAVAQLINDGETVFLSSGTTVYEVVPHLINRRLTVITNSLLILSGLANAEHIDLVGLGGKLRRSEMSLIGYITEGALTEVRADKVIFGIRAIDLEHGLTNDYMDETMTDRAILHIGREIIVAADHTKLGRISTAFVAPISIMNILVTDCAAPADFIQDLLQRGIRVITV
jgi:DeoR/GlpR family transcriptional regulator of sugar metabolism